jgi:gamma-glutamyl-gamma-aminobutyraldehyde dehydrogenase
MSELSHKDWISKASAIRFRDKAFIDGKTVAARSGRTFASINPATGETLAEVASCGEEDIDLAVAAARRSFEAGIWSRASPAHRKEVLLRLARLLRENLQELALLESLDMGKLVTDAATVDVPGSAAIFQWYGEAIDKIYDEVAPTGGSDLVLVRREPLGVIGARPRWQRAIPWC